MKKKIGLILIIGLLILFSANSIFAGFGVSPPKVLNKYLLPGSRFEQTIYLIQSKPEKDLLAKIEIDAPKIESWISIDRGLEFTIPAGVQQFPIKVAVDVPLEAEFGHYGGEMWVNTLPTDRGEGMVTVALGAVITFELNVSAEEMYGFVTRGVSIEDVEEGRSIKVGATLQNVGNVKDRPTKIQLDVYDQYRNKILYSGDAVNLNYVGPFETKTVIGKFRAGLAIGSYWAYIKVYKGENVLVEDKRVFYVVERIGLLYKIFSNSKWYSWVILWVIILGVLAIWKRKKIKILLKRWRVKGLKKKKVKIEKGSEKKKEKIEKKIRKLGM